MTVVANDLTLVELDGEVYSSVGILIQNFSGFLWLFPPTFIHFVLVVPPLSCVRLLATPWTAAFQAFLFLTTSQSLPKFMFVASVILFSHLILWHPLLLLPSIFPSIRDFSNELFVHIRWPKYWSFSFSIGPFSEYSRLISLKIEWFDHLVVQGTFRSLFRNHSSKASTCWHSAFFMVQLSQPYMTPRKTIAFTIWTFVSRVISLLFNTLSRFVISFLPRSSSLLISWLQPSSTVTLESEKMKPVTTSTFSPSVCEAVRHYACTQFKNTLCFVFVWVMCFHFCLLEKWP